MAHIESQPAVAQTRAWKVLAEIWGNQIENARGQTNVAIAHLSREFADIVASLDELANLARDIEREEGHLVQAVGTAAKAGDHGVIGQLTQSAQLLDQRSHEIRTSIEASLVHLQFQDRVNQILGHVQANILSLTRALAEQEMALSQSGTCPPIDFAGLMDEIARSYTTGEERATHGSQPATAADDEITFF